MDKYDITDYLKDDKELQKAVIEEFLNEIAEFKAENDKLKKELGNNKATYEVTLSTYNIECGNLLEENKQLWQTLQEIKAIAEQILNNNEFVYQNHRDIRQIVRLITKAEEE